MARQRDRVRIARIIRALLVAIVASAAATALFELDFGRGLVVPLWVVTWSPPAFYLLIAVVAMRHAPLGRRVGWALATCGVNAALGLLTTTALALVHPMSLAGAFIRALWTFVPAPAVHLVAAPLVMLAWRSRVLRPRVTIQLDRLPVDPLAPRPGGPSLAAATPNWDAVLRPPVPTSDPGPTPFERAGRPREVTAPAPVPSPIRPAAPAPVPPPIRPAAPAPVPSPIRPAAPAPFVMEAVKERAPFIPPSRPAPDEPLVRISFNRIATQLPPDVFVLPPARLSESLHEPHVLTVPRRHVVTQLGEGAVDIAWALIEYQFPELVFALPQPEVRRRFVGWHLSLPMDEVLPQIPPELWHVDVPAPDLSAIGQFPAPFAPEPAASETEPAPGVRARMPAPTPSPETGAALSMATPAVSDVAAIAAESAPRASKPVAEPPVAAANSAPIAPPTPVVPRAPVVAPPAVAPPAPVPPPPPVAPPTPLVPAAPPTPVDPPVAAAVPVAAPSAPITPAAPAASPAPLRVTTSPTTSAPLVRPSAPTPSAVPPGVTGQARPASKPEAGRRRDPEPVPALAAATDEESAALARALSLCLSPVGALDWRTRRVDNRQLVSFVSPALAREAVDVLASRAAALADRIGSWQVDQITIRTSRIACVLTPLGARGWLAATVRGGGSIALLELLSARARRATAGSEPAPPIVSDPLTIPAVIAASGNGRVAAAARTLAMFGPVVASTAAADAGGPSVYAFSADDDRTLVGVARAVHEALVTGHDDDALGRLESVALRRGGERAIVRPLRGAGGPAVLAAAGPVALPGRAHRAAVRAAALLETR